MHSADAAVAALLAVCQGEAALGRGRAEAAVPLAVALTVAAAGDGAAAGLRGRRRSFWAPRARCGRGEGQRPRAGGSGFGNAERGFVGRGSPQPLSRRMASLAQGGRCSRAAGLGLRGREPIQGSLTAGEGRRGPHGAHGRRCIAGMGACPWAGPAKSECERSSSPRGCDANLGGLREQGRRCCAVKRTRGGREWPRRAPFHSTYTAARVRRPPGTASVRCGARGSARPALDLEASERCCTCARIQGQA